MEPPLGLRGCRLVQRRRATRPGGLLFAPNRRAPLIVNRQSCWTVTTFGLCANPAFAPTGERVQVAPCSRASRRRVRFGPTHAPRQSASLAWARLSLGLAFVGPARHRRGRRFPTASGFGRFPPFAGERKTLTNP